MSNKKDNPSNKNLLTETDQVLDLYIKGHTPKQIAEELDMLRSKVDQFLYTNQNTYEKPIVDIVKDYAIESTTNTISKAIIHIENNLSKIISLDNRIVDIKNKLSSIIDRQLDNIDKNCSEEDTTIELTNLAPALKSLNQIKVLGNSEQILNIYNKTKSLIDITPEDSNKNDSEINITMASSDNKHLALNEKTSFTQLVEQWNDEYNGVVNETRVIEKSETNS